MLQYARERIKNRLTGGGGTDYIFLSGQFVGKLN